MKYYTNLNNKTFTDAYINFNVVYNYNDIDALTKELFVCSNCSLTVREFIAMLSKYEQQNNSTVNKGLASRLGATLTFLLDKQRDVRQLSQLAEEISNKIGSELPYWCYYIHKSNAYYLVMYFSDRVFYPEGIKKIIVAKENSYKNKKTGKICKADDENAIIFHRKGDVLKEITTNFSNKVNTFRFSSQFAFKKWVNKLKEWYVITLNELFKFSIEEGFSIPKFSYNGLTALQRNNAQHWNNTFKQVEEMFNEQLWRIKFIDLYNEETKVYFDLLFSKTVQIVKDKHFRYGRNQKGFISLDTRKPTTLRIYTEGFLYRCETELNITIQNIQNKYPLN